MLAVALAGTKLPGKMQSLGIYLFDRFSGVPQAAHKKEERGPNEGLQALAQTSFFFFTPHPHRLKPSSVR
jgi:hypothetical protein